MDPDTQLLHDCTPLFLQYKSGRVVRFRPTTDTPAGVDPTTGVTSKDITIGPVGPDNNKISARLYLPKLPPDANHDSKLPILVYYHGGGFCIESAFSSTYQPFLISLSSQANLLILSVNYRLAPEHPLPAAYDDSWAALDWAFGPNPDPWLTDHGDFSRVYVAGDSAGANISHHMAMRAGVRHKIKGMVLIHPYFWGAERIAGETTDPVMLGLLEGLWKAVTGPGMESLDDPMMNPLVDSTGLARLGCERAMVCVAEKDVLAERGRAYYAALVAVWEGTAEMVVSEGEEHVFHLIKPRCDKALELLDKLVGFFKIGA